MIDFEKLLSGYDYSYPSRLIANKPAFPRDAAKLLVYDRKSKTAKVTSFSDIGNYLPDGCLVVLNQTKVVPARLQLKKASGGKVALLYICHERRLVRALSNTTLKPGQILALGKSATFTVVAKAGREYLLQPSVPKHRFVKFLERYGTTPLPPYIKNSPLTEPEARKEYQTVFAKSGRSIAAPTASLHFTKRLLQKLRRQGIEFAYVNLNVSLGTFAPLTRTQLQTGRLHAESYAIDSANAKKIAAARASGRTIVAVGTTVVRALESAARQGKLKKLSGETALFIRPPYKFQMVGGLLTNFHVPKSSLLMLVAAFSGRKRLLELYKKAIKKNFRLFSFGDAMLII